LKCPSRKSSDFSAEGTQYNIASHPSQNKNTGTPPNTRFDVLAKKPYSIASIGAKFCLSLYLSGMSLRRDKEGRDEGTEGMKTG
jgi:hypothetical protein